MSGPWEDFQKAPASGPWDDFKETQPESLDAKRERVMANVLTPGGAYGADVIMGAGQVAGSLAQMLARGLESAMPEGGVKDVVSRARGLVESANQGVKDFYERNYQPEERFGSSVARGIGNSLPVMAVAPAVAGGGLVRNVAAGAAGGGLTAPLTPIYEPVDNKQFWLEKGKQAATGAAVGGATGLLGSVVSSAIAPKLQPAQKAMTDEGISLTPGQAAGGWLKGLEDRAAGFPLIGDLINKNRAKGITDFNRAIYSRAVAPFGDEGAKVAAKADVGHAGIKQIGDFLSEQYDKALAKSVPAVIDDAFIGGVSKVGGMVPEQQKADFLRNVQQEIINKITPGRTITPSVAKEIESRFGQLAADYRSSSVASERAVSQAYRQIQEEARDLFARANPETAPMIKAANEGWATIVQMEKAGAMLGAKDGIFTPAQLLNAIKSGAQGVRKRQFARGDALNQDFVEAAKGVLPNQVPDSGTPGRIAAAAAAGNLPTIAASLMSPAGLAMGAATMPYMPGLGPLLMRMALNRPEGATRLADLARSAVPALAVPAAAVVGQP